MPSQERYYRLTEDGEKRYAYIFARVLASKSINKPPYVLGEIGFFECFLHSDYDILSHERLCNTGAYLPHECLPLNTMLKRGHIAIATQAEVVIAKLQGRLGI